MNSKEKLQGLSWHRKSKFYFSGNIKIRYDVKSSWPKLTSTEDELVERSLELIFEITNLIQTKFQYFFKNWPFKCQSIPKFSVNQFLADKKSTIRTSFGRKLWFRIMYHGPSHWTSDHRSHLDRYYYLIL